MLSADPILLFKRKLSPLILNLQVGQEKDPLTELLNRRGLFGRLDERMAQIKSALFKKNEHNTNEDLPPLTVAMLDLDYFKRVNDDQGKEVGDQALRQVARILKNGVKGGIDYVNRWGGEEFVIIFGANAEIGVLAAERLRGAIEQNVKTPDPNWKQRVSIGLYQVTEDQIVDFFEQEALQTTDESRRKLREDFYEEIINRADQPLTVAKRSGRNRVAVMLKADSTKVVSSIIKDTTGNLIIKYESGNAIT